MDKIFFIDAYAIIYRSYFAFIKSPRINSQGLNTSAVMGFCNTLVEVLRKEQPDYLGVAFDPHGPTFRDDIFPAYKAQRDKTPEDIRRSVPIIKDLLKAWRIPILEVEGYEADDVIGTLSMKSAEKGLETYMLTPDKDYAQLVRKDVYVYRPRHGGGYETMGVAEVLNKYGIKSPHQVIDLLGLMGDSADNFPGCPGVGEKTATKLIEQFGNIDELLKRTDELKGALKTKIETHVDDIKMSRFLATIKTDVSIELDLDALKVSTPDEPRLRALLDDLELKTLLNRIFNKTKDNEKKVEIQPDLFASFTNEDTEKPKTGLNFTIKTVPHTYECVDNVEDMKKIRDIFLQKSTLSLDTETTSTNAIDAELVGLSFSFDEFHAYYVPVPAQREEAQKVVDIFKPVYESEQILKVGQNIKYDMEVLYHYGVTLKGRMFDTMIAHYLIRPDQRHGMDELAATLLHYQTIPIEDLIGPKGKHQKSMRDVDIAVISEYACEDADVTLRLKNILEPMLNDVGADRLFWEIEMPLVPVLAQMELHGIRLDSQSLHETSLQFTRRMQEIEQTIYQLAGESFNISSPKQVGDILFGKLAVIDKPKKTKTGQYVTSEEVLQQLAGRHEIVEKILAYRGLKKLLSTYVDVLPTLVNPRTGHIHTSFNQTITATGRLSSSDPNLQNIPVRGEDGKEIRKAFIPDEGCLFFSADYSQIELRVMAHLSGDRQMIEAFREGRDIHAATAAKIYRKPMEEVTRDERNKAKRANFGIIYGITVFGLAERLDIDRTEAKQLIDGYFETFPQVKEYMEQAKAKAREYGYAETISGRRRYLPDINSHNATVRGFAERNAINAPIQGSAADIIKMAMIRIHQRFEEARLRSKMILQVHDELNFSVFPEEQKEVEKIVLDEMQQAIELHVPTVADAGWGSNWLEAH